MGLRAVIHARESVFEAKAGNRSPEEQVAESRAWCEREGIEVAHVVMEEGTGASRHSKARNRKKWEHTKRLLLDGDDHGSIDMLVTWSSTRAHRNLDEYVLLRRLCVDAGVLWAYNGRVYDMNDGDDRFRTAMDGAIGERDVEEIRRGVLRSTRANAAAGRPHGRLLYGYRRIYDPVTRAFIRQESDPDTAPIVRQIFADYLAGHSLNSIVADLNDRRIPTQRGKQWIRSSIVRMLRNRGYLGERSYQSKTARKTGEPATITSTDAWPPIIDSTTFDRVQARLDSLNTVGRRQAPTARLLTGIAICSVCLQKLHVIASSKRPHKYSCPAYHSARAIHRLDAYVSGAILERLGRQDVEELFADGDDPAVAEARARAAELRAELEKAYELWQAKELSVAGYARMETDLTPQIEEADRAARRAAIPIDIDVPPPERLVPWWHDELTAEQRREYAAAMIVAVVVMPVGRGRRDYGQDEYTMIEWRQFG